MIANRGNSVPDRREIYEVEEVEALPGPARQVSIGPARQRSMTRSGPLASGRTARTPTRSECFYTGLRLGEVLTLRWEDVDLTDRMLLVRRGLSAGEETTPKGRRHRFVPLSMPAVAAFARLAERGEFTEPDDYVLANRFGRRLDASALRHRYKRGRTAAGLRPSACTVCVMPRSPLPARATLCSSATSSGIRSSRRPTAT